MIFLSPLALFLGLIAVPIVLLYVLKLRRPRRPVASTLLWRRVIEDVRADAPWQRLRPNLLLLLQLLAVAALVLTLSHPAYSQRETIDGDLVVIVDQAPAMTATDVTPSRFAAAQSQARELAAQLSAGSVMSVVGMGVQPHLVVAESADRGAIDRGIDALRPGSGLPNVSAALSLAASLSRDAARTSVIILTSRDSGVRPPSTSLPFPLEIVRFGGRLRDVAITSFSAAQVRGHTEATLTVRNLGFDRAESDLDLFADNQLADVRPLSINSGQQQTLVWTGLPGGLERMHAALTRRDDVRMDKDAYFVIPSPLRRSILLVTQGNPWLRASLGLNGSFSVTTVLPAAYAFANPDSYDLVVYDGFLPRALPAVPALIVAPPAGRVDGLGFRASVASAGATPQAVSLPGTLSGMLQYVDLSDVHISRLRFTRLPSWMQTVVSMRGVPVLAAGEGAGSRVAVMTFDVRQSDWPLRVSFPILMHNLLAYLSPTLGLNSVNIQTGQSLDVGAEVTVRAVDVARPDGTTDHLRAPLAAFTDTAEPGFYSVQEHSLVQEQPLAFAVNGYPSRGTPVTAPAIQWFGKAHLVKGHGSRSHVDLAWAAALGALGLLTLEWWYAWRR